MKPRKLLSHRWRHVMVSTDDRCCIVIGVLKSIISQIEVRDFHKKHDIKCCLWEIHQDTLNLFRAKTIKLSSDILSEYGKYIVNKST